MISMRSKTVIVTGAASGIGLACAKAMLAAGARVELVDRNERQLEDVAAQLATNAHTLDIADEDGVARVIDKIADDAGAIDVLINCAGVLQRTLPPDQLSLKEWDLVVRVHLRGTYLMCARAGSLMAACGQGSIVNIASISGMRSGPLHAYGPAKAGIINLSECLAGEWGRRGVRVNTISPGFTRTPALETGFSTNTLDDRNLIEASALGRLVAADEIANAALFLASDMASAITGITLPVDAGFLVATPWQAFGGVRGS